MKKIININFQGRVIPIEETAYDILKYYIESLRGYFANEEGRDEIINDIESRIAELFSDRLKRLTSCITDDDVNSVIASIGRPEDLEEAEGPQTSTTAGAPSAGATGQEGFQQAQPAGTSTRSLYRSENDKILGGVAAGLANYFGIDPSIMRLIFVLFLFMGFGIILYVILWIVVPSRALVTTVKKRLFRNPDSRMIGGVAGGIAAYLNIDVWIPRIIFLAPFILGAVASVFTSGWIGFDPVPNFFFNGFGGTLFIIYIVLWIVLPTANTATEKLEMRGEKVDLESIKKTVKEDLENLKGRAEKMGGEIKERAQYFGQEVRQAGQQFATQAGPVVRRSGSGLGHAIGVLFKAFFLFVAGIIVFALVMALVAIMFSGVGVFPFKDFLLDGFWQNFLAWSTLVLFLGIPIIALLTWLIRRIVGVKSHNSYLGYTFGSLWFLGLVSAILLTGSIARSFRSKTSVKEDISIAQPASGKMLVKVTEENVKYYGSDWFGFDGHDWPFFSKSEDSIMMNTIRLKLIKSTDSSYHVYAVKFSNGNTPRKAESLASNISFPVSQVDSLLYLPKGFVITQDDKFRNQQLMLVIEIPLGKRIQVDRNVDRYSRFNINLDGHRGWNVDWNDRWDNSFGWDGDKEYIMTRDGLQDVNKEKEDKKDENEDNSDRDNNESRDSSGNGKYRYKGGKNDTIIIRTDTTRPLTLYHEKKRQPSSASDANDSGTDLYASILLFR